MAVSPGRIAPCVAPTATRRVGDVQVPGARTWPAGTGVSARDSGRGAATLDGVPRAEGDRVAPPRRGAAPGAGARAGADPALHRVRPAPDRGRALGLPRPR